MSTRRAHCCQLAVVGPAGECVRVDVQDRGHFTRRHERPGDTCAGRQRGADLVVVSGCVRRHADRSPFAAARCSALEGARGTLTRNSARVDTQQEERCGVQASGPGRAPLETLHSALRVCERPDRPSTGTHPRHRLTSASVAPGTRGNSPNGPCAVGGPRREPRRDGPRTLRVPAYVTRPVGGERPHRRCGGR
jgi:hypothetical protein